jgi:hypothetical protein
MNIAILHRAFRRVRYAKTRRAYEGFLDHIDSHGDVWKVPQREIADWWEARQGAELEAAVSEKGRLGVSCRLSGAAIEVDGKDLRIPPFECPVSVELPAGKIRITCECGGGHSAFLRELLGHLGYGHVTPLLPGERADIDRDRITPVLMRLRETARLHWRYEAGDLDEFHAIMAEAHHGRGVPLLRIWTLPHRDGMPYRAAVSSRYDVDRAIVNMPAIHELEGRYNLRSTAYVRPMGPFYGAREIRSYKREAGSNEIALHGEFVTTARDRFGDEFTAAAREKERLEEILEEGVAGVCMHGGELVSNMTENTRAAVEAARFKYETIYRNYYYLPLHLPDGDGAFRTLSIGQHFADLSVATGPRFTDELLEAFINRFSRACAVGGIFVPVLHPLYFNISNYLRSGGNLFRLAAFVPRLLIGAARMRRGQSYLNRS